MPKNTGEETPKGKAGNDSKNPPSEVSISSQAAASKNASISSSKSRISTGSTISAPSLGKSFVPHPKSEVDTITNVDEAEVLPYESVFQWECCDPVGIYEENEKYNELLDEFENDEIKTAIVKGMWKDRGKYQILRRFTWPPPVFFKQAFLTRGYYEDYEPRPGINVANWHVSHDKKRMKKEIICRTGAEHREEIQEIITNINNNVGVGAGHGIHDGVKEKDNKTSHDTTKDAAQGGLIPSQERAEKKKAPKVAQPSVVTGQKRSLSEFDPVVYNRQILVITGLPLDTKQEYIDDLFPTGIVEMKPNGKNPGGFDAIIEFQSDSDSAEAFRRVIKTKLQGRVINILPQLRPIESRVVARDEMAYANPYMVKKKFQEAETENTDKKRKSKSRKSKTEPEQEIKDEFTSEVVQKDKSKKMNKKSKSDLFPTESKEVTSEVIPKDKKKKSKTK